MKTIRFKSTPENWIKEFTGVKSNTIRRLEIEDIRNEVLIDWLCNPFILNIEIENSLNHSTFTREVKDVTKWEGFFIISW